MSSPEPHIKHKIKDARVTIDEPSFYRYVNSANPYVRAALAKNPNCPINCLQQLATDCTYRTVANVIENPNSTPEIYQQIIETPGVDESLIYLIVQSSKLTYENLMRILKLPLLNHTKYIQDLALKRLLTEYYSDLKTDMEKQTSIDLTNTSQKYALKLAGLV